MAIQTLDGWGRARWPSDAEALVARAAAIEPDSDVRLRLHRLLAGQPIDSRD